jgi:hypothetical protein
MENSESKGQKWWKCEKFNDAVSLGKCKYRLSHKDKMHVQTTNSKIGDR